MILENLNYNYYGRHLSLFYSHFEEDEKLGVADKLLIKKIFDNSVRSEANSRLIDGESEEWAHSVAPGIIARQIYFGVRKINPKLIGF